MARFQDAQLKTHDFRTLETVNCLLCNMPGLTHTKLVTCRHRHHEHHNSRHSDGIFWQGHE